ncbi:MULTISPECIES: hypothetical protein [unclassified Sphingomonas]|nr:MULTISPECIES: hypothetical protein [unclassified Sphingomonas]
MIKGNDIPEKLYKSVLPESMNVRFVENHVIIDRPANAVFDWVTTWGNISKWLAVADEAELIRGGPIEKPSRIGDVLLEYVPPKYGNTSSNEPSMRKTYAYTVVVLVEGLLWIAAGQSWENGVAGEKIRFVQIFSTKSLSETRTLFSRTFHFIKDEVVNPVQRYPVDDPELMQESLKRLKAVLEAETPTQD